MFFFPAENDQGAVTISPWKVSFVVTGSLKALTTILIYHHPYSESLSLIFCYSFFFVVIVVRPMIKQKFKDKHMSETKCVDKSNLLYEAESIYEFLPRFCFKLFFLLSVFHNLFLMLLPLMKELVYLSRMMKLWLQTYHYCLPSEALFLYDLHEILLPQFFFCLSIRSVLDWKNLVIWWL